MNLKKPDFWNKKNLLAYIFLPFTIITHTINFFKKLIVCVIKVKGKKMYANRFLLFQKSGFFKFIKNMFI